MLHGTPEPGLSCARASIDPVNLSICAGGGLPEVVGDAGLVCPLENEAWVRALEAVKMRREELVAAGKDRARAFTSEISATELVEQYDLVLAAARGIR